jgi:hypothetical protein
MDRPVLRPIRPLKPALVPPEVLFVDPQKPRGTTQHTSASPDSKRRIRPGWKATIVRSESFARLRAIQKSTTDPVIDLSYLADACLQMALDIGPEAIVQRALSGLHPKRTKP